MSEPYSAFIKLQLDYPALVKWLDAPVPMASRWSDWRAIGGKWYLGDGPSPLAGLSDAGLAEQLVGCDGMLRRYKDNREALRRTIGYAEAEQLRIAAYDRAKSEFIAGTLTYSENLTDFMVFLTVARGSADFLGAGAYGIAVVHNYIWPDNDTVVALRMNPSGRSEFLAEQEKGSAVGAFERVAAVMMDGSLSDGVTERDQLDRLR